MDNQTPAADNKIVTIPNCMSLFRLLLIPLCVWLYYFREAYLLAVCVLLVSGITDIVDGLIARRFHMVSNVGKILDPIADKATQFAMLICLFLRFPHMAVPFVLLLLKETFAAVTGILAIRRTQSAAWHGKTTTVVLYCTIFIHMIWYSIPVTVSRILTALCVCVMLLSGILYGIHNIRLVRQTPPRVKNNAAAREK